MSSDKGRIKAIDTTSVHKICSGQVRPLTAGAAEEGLAKWMELPTWCRAGIVWGQAARGFSRTSPLTGPIEHAGRCRLWGSVDPSLPRGECWLQLKLFAAPPKNMALGGFSATWGVPGRAGSKTVHPPQE